MFKLHLEFENEDNFVENFRTEGVISKISSFHRSELNIGKSKSSYIFDQYLSAITIIVLTVGFMLVQFLLISRIPLLKYPLFIMFAAFLYISYIGKYGNEVWRYIKKSEKIRCSTEQINVLKIHEKFYITLYNFDILQFEVYEFSLNAIENFLLEDSKLTTSLYFIDLENRVLLLQEKRQEISIIEKKILKPIVDFCR